MLFKQCIGLNMTGFSHFCPVVIFFAVALAHAAHDSAPSDPIVHHIEPKNGIIDLEGPIPSGEIYVPLNSSFVRMGQLNNGFARLHLKFTLDEEHVFRVFQLFMVQFNKTLVDITKAAIPDVDGKISVLRRRAASVRNSLELISALLGVYRTEDTVERYTKAAEDDFVSMVFEEATQWARERQKEKEREKMMAADRDSNTNQNQNNTSPDSGSDGGTSGLVPDDTDNRIQKRSTTLSSTSKIPMDQLNSNPELAVTEDSVEETTLNPLLEGANPTSAEDILVRPSFEDIPVELQNCSTMNWKGQEGVFVYYGAFNCTGNITQMIKSFLVTRDSMDIMKKVTWEWPVLKNDSRSEYDSKALLVKTDGYLDGFPVDQYLNNTTASLSQFLNDFPQLRLANCYTVLAAKHFSDEFFLLRAVERLTKLYEVVKKFYQTEESPDVTKLAFDLDRVLFLLHSERNRLSENQPLKRTKRQLMALIGGLSMATALGSSLYSMVEVHELSNQMDTLRTNQGILAHEVAESHRVINDLHSRLGTLINVTSNLATELSSSTKTTKANNVLNRLEGILGDLDDDVSALFSTVEDLLRGFFSTKYMDGLELAKALESADSVARNAGYQLLTPLISEVYRSPTSYFMNNGKLEVFVHLDVVKTEPLSLFKFLGAYLPVSGKDEVIRVSSPDQQYYIARSPTHHQQGLLLTESDVNSCRKVKGHYLCPDLAILRNDISQTCLGYLMDSELDSEVIMDRCVVEIYKDHKRQEEIERVGRSRVYYHTFEPRMFTLSCGSDRPIYKQLQPGSYMIRVRSGCSFSTTDVVFTPEEDLSLDLPNVMVVRDLDKDISNAFLDLRGSLGSTLQTLKTLEGGHPETLHTVLNLHDVRKSTHWLGWLIALSAVILSVVLCFTTYCLFRCGFFSRCLRYELVRRDVGDRKVAAGIEMQPIIRRGRVTRGGEQELDGDEPVPTTVLQAT